MSKKRERTKGRKTYKSFFGLPHDLLESANFISLSPRSVKLLIDIGVQYRGKNNGDLCIAWKLMKERGWKSKSQLHKAKTELLEKGILILSRVGGRNKATLFALSFNSIDECIEKKTQTSKLDINPTIIPLNTWKKK